MNREEQAEKMEKYLLETQYPLECEDIPKEDLNDEEKTVVDKCMNHEELTDDEFTLLKATLQRYRGAINKHRPAEVVDAYEKTQNMILTEKDFLNIVDDKSSRILKVNVPYLNQWYRMEFEILPLDDSRVVSTLQTHINLFDDYSKEEINLWTKAQQGQVISPEEQKIIGKMTEEIESRNSEDRIAAMNKFLAAQLRLPDSTSDFDTRLEFWEKFPFVTKSAIMMRVEDRLGLTDQQDEKLFPVGE